MHCISQPSRPTVDMCTRMRATHAGTPRLFWQSTWRRKGPIVSQANSNIYRWHFIFTFLLLTKRLPMTFFLLFNLPKELHTCDFWYFRSVPGHCDIQVVSDRNVSHMCPVIGHYMRYACCVAHRSSTTPLRCFVLSNSTLFFYFFWLSIIFSI